LGQMARSLTRVRSEMTTVPRAIGMSGLRNRPSGPRWPTRSSLTWLGPPEMGFWWHSRQDCALYSGPRPSPISSTSSKLVRSASWVASPTIPLLLLSNPAGASDADGLGVGGVNGDDGLLTPQAVMASAMMPKEMARQGRG